MESCGAERYGPDAVIAVSALGKSKTGSLENHWLALAKSSVSLLVQLLSAASTAPAEATRRIQRTGRGRRVTDDFTEEIEDDLGSESQREN
jgi:hypothetical protein